MRANTETMINPQLKIFLLLFCFASVLSCSETKKEDPAAKSDAVCITDSLAKIIRIDSASMSSIKDELKLSGEISFNENKVIKLFPFSSGQVEHVFVSLGDKVSKGQTLATIRSAEIAGNYSDLSQAGSDESIAKRQLANTESLYQNGIASEKDYLEAKENYQKAMMATKKIREQLSINGKGNTSVSGEYAIKSPINGYVVEKKITQGAFIRNDNSESLLTVGDINEVWVWANVYESDISKVKEGYTATVTTLAYAGKNYPGLVDKVSQSLDPVTKVMKIRIRLPNASHELKPEMFANILLANKEGKKAVTLPAAAILTDNGKQFVVVYHNKCNLELKEVQVIKTVENIVYISSGIQPGEKVITQNQVLLYKALLDKS